MKINVLLDTDPGSDIDDAICIAYLLSNPHCNLLGITTVTGEATLRAQVASAVCYAYGRPEIPIFPGAELPLLVKSNQPHAPHAKVLPRWPHQSDFPVGAAVDFMRSTIRQAPGQVEIIAIGALTNVALLFAIDPEIPSLLRGLTIMGGRFFDGAAAHCPVEHNIRCDPHAAAMVFASASIPRINAVGLDVTFQVTQAMEEIRQSFCPDPFKPILAMAEEWFTGAQRLCYHDIVAASTVFEPDVCSFERGVVTVETCGPTMAVTSFEPAPEGRHFVAATVDRKRFLDHFCSVTGCLPVHAAERL